MVHPNQPLIQEVYRHNLERRGELIEASEDSKESQFASAGMFRSILADAVSRNHVALQWNYGKEPEHT